MAGIYVHIPFCKSKCTYCDFVSFPGKLGFAEGYMACLYQEMTFRKEQLKDYVFDSLYIGGGTPSIIDETYIAMLLSAVKKNFQLSPTAEITIEMNPGTVNANKIALYKKCGINRFSVGLQTANDEQLRNLNRIHTLNEFVTCANLLKGENFSVDVMIGLKGQTLEDIAHTIEVASSFGASHISMYALSPEDGTPIYTDYLNGELPDGDEVAEMYAFGVEKLRSLGFERYEVSNFCRDGKFSRHNLNYWKRGEYIGFGVSASSHIANVRFTNTFDLDEYFKCILSHHLPVVNEEEVSLSEQEEETIMLALRTDAGLDLQAYQATYGYDFLERYAPAIAKNQAFLQIADGRIRILPDYLFVQNTIIIDFFKE